MILLDDATIKINNSKMKEILMIFGTLFHLFDWCLLHFFKKLKNKERKQEQKQYRSDRGKITWTKPHDLGNQAFVQSQKSVAEEKQTKHIKQ